MKLCINGSRDITDYDILLKAIAFFKIDPKKVEIVVSGGAGGADKLGEQWAKEHNIPIKLFKPNWNDLTAPDCVVKVNKFGKKYDAKAGFRRNSDMEQFSDAILSLQTNGVTAGTDDCYKKFVEANKVAYHFGDDELKAHITGKSVEEVKADEEIPF